MNRNGINSTHLVMCLNFNLKTWLVGWTPGRLLSLVVVNCNRTVFIYYICIYIMLFYSYQPLNVFYSTHTFTQCYCMLQFSYHSYSVSTAARGKLGFSDLHKECSLEELGIGSSASGSVDDALYLLSHSCPHCSYFTLSILDSNVVLFTEYVKSSQAG